MQTRSFVTLAGLALTGLALAGCSSGGSAPGPLARPSTTTNPEARSAVDGAIAAARPDNVAVPVVADATAIIRTAEIAVVLPRGDDLARQTAAAAGIAAAAGGSVFSEDRTDDGSTVVLKVPPAQLNAVLGRLSALGDERSRVLGSKDVTGEVADVDARLASARASLVRLQQLFTQARTVADVLAVENNIATRQATLESLEAQQRALAGQTGYATVTLSLTVAAPAAAPSRHGFAAGLHAGWTALLATGRGIAAAAGAMLPFLPALVLAALAIAVLRRRRGSGRSPRPTRA